MPITKSQIKRTKTNEKRRLINASFRSSMRSAIKDVEAAIFEKDLEKAKAAFSLACKKLDKAVAKGIKHKNYAARHKSRLAKKINEIA